jgi:hypothetical protein
LGGKQTFAYGDKSKWAELLTPIMLFYNVPTKVEDDLTVIGLTESVHPVRRAEIAFKLLGKAEEFVQYNRFGDDRMTKMRSSLPS